MLSVVLLNEERPMTTPLHRAVALAGSQTKLARRIGVKQMHVWNWLNRSKDSFIKMKRQQSAESANAGRAGTPAPQPGRGNAAALSSVRQCGGALGRSASIILDEFGFYDATTSFPSTPSVKTP